MKILDDMDPEIRDAFLAEHEFEDKYGDGTLTASSSSVASSEVPKLKHWQMLTDPFMVAFKWQQLRNYNKVLLRRKEYENRHRKGGNKPEERTVQE